MNEITLSQAVALLAERGYVSPQKQPFAKSTLQKAAREGRLQVRMIGKTYVTSLDAVIAWATNDELHKTGKPPVK